MVKWTGKRIINLNLYKELAGSQSKTLVGLEHIPFVILYIVCLYYCYLTIGEQYIEALTKAEEQQINVYDEAERARVNALSYLQGGSGAKVDTKDPTILIPSRWLPGFWPSVALGVCATLHALMVLGQRWSISFRCLIRFRAVNRVSLATHVHVTPGQHQGKEELVPIQRTASGNTFFEFHRRKYVYDAKTDTFTKVRCRTDYEVNHYTTWSGIPSDAVFTQLKELYGANKFQMASPSFFDLYINQITAPFTVFQLFCSLLWCLDEYWQYSLFTLFMIFTFEATAVFQRQQSMKMLKGMGNEIRPIKVYRDKKWIEVNTEDLVPGDLISLTKTKDDVVPCDAIIVYGSVVVNEASLTGESVPQMKDGITALKGDIEIKLNIKGEHKVHALFGGTRLLQVTSMKSKLAEALEDERDDVLEKLQQENSDTNGGPDLVHKAEQAVHDNGNKDSAATIVPIPPDDGCVCYVSRTGFSSSQGKLVRMIESSQAAVRSDTYDTVLLLLLLLVFALISSGYVLYKGMQDGTQSRYQLLLHCILIVTSVIPPELPMQTALAVNNSLMTLMRMQIFCTEPFRVPLAGRIDTCVYDKTGTLTTDELVAVGIVQRDASHEAISKAYTEALKAQEAARVAEALKASVPKPPTNPATPAPIPEEPAISTASTAGMISMTDADAACTLILGGCHSLVLIDGKASGDPLEVASLRAVKWELPPTFPDCARPKPEILAEKPKVLSFEGKHGNTSITLSQVKILARHHFSSKLQRMSVVVKLAGDDGSAWVLVKGSPEALALMCDDCPKDYQALASDLAKRGMRVIALGLRRIASNEISSCCEFRAIAETKLHFAGFISFTCRVRKDSAKIVKCLRDGGHVVAMATGDAMLTGIHVAKEVGITTQTKKGILLLEHDNSTGFYWADYESGDRSEVSFQVGKMTELAKSYDLCASGKVLMAALDKDVSLESHLNEFVVFARMRPDEKERVLVAMKNNGLTTLMCGDGANDVGALKQAHVGVALLSGFGDLNVSREAAKKKTAEEEKKEAQDKAAILTAQAIDQGGKLVDSELQVLKVSEIKKKLRLIGVEPDDYPQCVEKADLIQLYKTKFESKQKEKTDAQKHKELMALPPKERAAVIAKERKELAEKKQKEFVAEYERLQRAGDSWAMVNAVRNMWKKEQEAARESRAKNMSFTGSAGRMATFMEEMQGAGLEDLDLPMVKIGDASVASPFTSKMPSIQGSLDIIRQGRCTLVTTIQMYQILALNCLINAYSLSVLRLDGIKYGDIQMTCLGVLMSVSFITISRSKPLEKLSPVRPIRSIFHPALFLSLMGQFVIHLVTMMFLVRECKKLLPEGYHIEKSKVFQPNIVNSVVFLVTAVQQVSVFVVNLKGPPFMGGLVENTPLLYSLVTTFIGTFMCASEYIPQMNKFLQLEPFPSLEFRNVVLGVLMIDVAGSFIWDRLMLAIFALPILKASLASTTRQDVMTIVRGIIIVWVLVSWIGSQDYTEIAKELERIEKEKLGAAGAGVQSQTTDWSATIGGTSPEL